MSRFTVSPGFFDGNFLFPTFERDELHSSRLAKSSRSRPRPLHKTSHRLNWKVLMNESPLTLVHVTQWQPPSFITRAHDVWIPMLTGQLTALTHEFMKSKA